MVLPLAAAGTPAATQGLFTIVDGEATVWRDAQSFAGVEGLRLRADDVVRTTPMTRLARIELDDGRTIDLGPGTQAMLLPRVRARDTGRTATLYVLQGWVKLTNPTSVATAIDAPNLRAARIVGSLVAWVAPDTQWLFAEAGVCEVAPRPAAGAATAQGAAQVLVQGDSYLVHAPQPGQVVRLPPAELRGQVPRAFLDTLPRRAERYAGGGVEPSQPVEVRYAEVAPWLHVSGEPALRASLVPRLAARSRDRAFRDALRAELPVLPEWRALLLPVPPRHLADPLPAGPAGQTIARKAETAFEPPGGNAEFAPPLGSLAH